MSVIVRSADSKPNPDGYITGARYAELQLDNATGIVLTTPTAATTLADATNGWTAGAASNFSDGLDFTVSATAGTITARKATVVRVSYSISDVTAVNTAVNTLEVYIGSTASKGKAVWTGLTAAPICAAASVILTLAVGDVVAVKVIASTGNFTCKRGFFRVEEL